jgi:flavin reductase (DIM6/NTAB) family NADH-FMN oxidoreductase RutF/DNA-binding MarR family transcriptional regulator
VIVMTASDGEQCVGMSVNSFAALSLEPPLVLWSIRRQSGSLESFRRAGHFAVNVLAEDQVELANLFANPKEDKFARSAWTRGASGAPLLHGTIAQFECELDQLVEGGDHLILIGRVTRYARYTGEPLLFAQGRYASTQEHPGAVSGVAAPTPRARPDEAIAASLLRLLHVVGQRTTADFAAERQAEGLSIAQYRILGWLYVQPYRIATLKQLAYLGGCDADDALALMRERGEIEQGADGRLHLSASGLAAARALSERAAAFEAAMVEGLPPEDVAATRRVLAAWATRALEASTPAHA